jgi:hypothetical protein
MRLLAAIRAVSFAPPARPMGFRGAGRRADIRYPEGMRGNLRHVVLFAFREDAPADQVRTIEEAFAALKGQIPGIVDFEWGTNESPEGLNQGFTHCFVVTFDDAAARDAYLPHPAHVAFGALLQPILDRVLVVDYVARDQ